MKTRLILSFLATAYLPLSAQEEFNAVEKGKTVFSTMGCIECHVVAKDDNSLKTGPSLYGLFTTTPRKREVGLTGKAERQTVTADKPYFINSVRKSWDVLAVAEQGPTKGRAYLPVMPMYTSEIISDQDLESMWHYLRTLADPGTSGPATVMLKKQKPAAVKSMLEIPNEVLITTRARVFRAPLRGSSGRALHVGLPNGMNYTFDPRLLSVRNIWAGGFLNLSEERKGRGRPGSPRGKGARVFVEGGAILQPLQASGKAVDFEFKEPDVMDHPAIEKWLWEKRDFPQLQASMDAEFLGHSLDSESSNPLFRFRVGKNTFSQSVTVTDDGRIEIVILGKPIHPQKFKVNAKNLSDVKVNGGILDNGVWTIPADNTGAHTFSARMSGGLVARQRIEREENWTAQPLTRNPGKAGRQPLELPAGYSMDRQQVHREGGE